MFKTSGIQSYYKMTKADIINTVAKAVPLPRQILYEIYPFDKHLFETPISKSRHVLCTEFEIETAFQSS